MTGTVFDIGYRNYTGAREGRNRSQLAVFKDGLRIALGLGRPPRAKVLPWFFLALLALIGLILALVTAAVERMRGVVEPPHTDLYGVASILLFVFAALVAPELLCRDRREGTINLYLVRPLKGTDYVAARWAAFLVIMLAAAWVPQTILFLGVMFDTAAPLEYLRWNWLDILRFLGAGAAIAAYATSLALLTASFTTRRAYASVFLVGLFVISTPFTIGLASEVDGPVGQWISMFNLTNIPMHVNDVIFGEPSEITEQAPARELGSTVLVSWYFLWTLGAAALLWWRYRRLTP